jgi:hypothetical protein
MPALDLAKRLLSTSAILFFGAIAISVMTRDEWLAIAHAAGIVSAVIAAIGVLLLMAAGLRRIGLAKTGRSEPDGSQEHKLGQSGWD